MKAKKLPSGNWRCRVYSHTDSTGKKIYQSFTAPTKQQAEMEAAKWRNSLSKTRPADITVKQAVSDYLESNDGTLSPSTIYNYKKDAKRLQPIEHLKIRKLDNTIVQTFLSQLSKSGLAPKTVRNTYTLLRSSLAHAKMEPDFKIHLPQDKKERKKAPKNEQIMALYNNANPTMKIAIMLASRHSLRRGEICALTYGDLEGNILYVHSDMVMGPDGWVHKETPKTSSSNRAVYLTDEEVELLGTGSPTDYIVPLTPGTVGTNFYNLKKKLGIDIRFHDLRVFFASVSAAIGIPELYTAHHGGWQEGSKTLRDHYKFPMDEADLEFAKKLNDHFKNMSQNMTQN